MKKRNLRIGVTCMAIQFGVCTALVNTGLDCLLADAMVKQQYDIRTDQGEETSYIVVMEDKEDYEQLVESAEEKQLLVEQETNLLEDSQTMVLDMTVKEAAQVESMEGVTICEKDVPLSANEAVPLDENEIEKAVKKKKTLDFSQWNLDAIGLEYDSEDNDKEAESTKSYSGNGVRVAVLDSGVSYSEGVTVKKRVDLVGMNNENPLFDDASGHGTGIAGIVAASDDTGDIKGIAEDVSLYSVKVLDENNQAPVSRVIEGIYWCIENEIDVINMSFGTTVNSTALYEAVKAAQKEGIIMVAAAGNGGREISQIEYPAAYDQVISVGATDSINKITDFTSGGKELDLAAPGEKIWTYSVFGGLMAVDGTSIAAAHVTAAVALLLEKKPDADQEYVRQLLRSTSVLVDEKEETGLLNIANALERADDFLAASYEETVPKEQSLEEYDTSGIVSGCWSSTNHAATVATSSSYNIMVAATAASKVDSVFPTGEKTNARYGILHGRHNYVANLHALYKVAKSMRASQYDLNTSSGRKKFLDTINTSYVTHSSDTTYGAADMTSVRRIISEVLGEQEEGDTGYKSTSILSESGATLTSSERCAWVVIGLAAHLLGDIYAHRTMVPVNTGGSTAKSSTVFNKSHFKDWDYFDKKVSNFVIEFRDIKSYLKDSIDGKAALYEDDTSFYPNRYTATRNTVNNLVCNFSDKKTFTVKSVMVDNSEFKRKLNNFSAYTKSAGFTVDVSSMSTTNFRVNLYMKSSGAEGIAINEYDYVDYNFQIC